MRLLQNDPAISMYFVIDRPLGKGLEKLNFWTSSVMVIRKDDKYPTFSIDDDSVNLGSVFKAIGKRKVQDPHYYYNYYKLKQVG
jgi:hypothetical protein